MADVFLSYARRDAAMAERLRHALLPRGISVDTDADIVAGADWGDHLRATMNAAEAVVVLITPAARNSAAVMSEVGAVVAAGKLVVPIVTTSKGLPAGLPAPLRHWSFVRAANRDADDVAAEIDQRPRQASASAA